MIIISFWISSFIGFFVLSSYVEIFENIFFENIYFCQLGARLGGIEMAKAFLHSQIKTIPLGHCLARAKFLHRMDPVKYPTIVFRSLGFKHDDGRIYWEYG